MSSVIQNIANIVNSNTYNTGVMESRVYDASNMSISTAYIESVSDDRSKCNIRMLIGKRSDVESLISCQNLNVIGHLLEGDQVLVMHEIPLTDNTFILAKLNSATVPYSEDPSMELTNRLNLALAI